MNMIQLAAGAALEDGRGDIVTDDIQWVARTCHHARRIYGEIRRESAAGVCAGLAVTGSGGGISIEIECTARRVGKGQGKLRLLGMVEEEEIDLRSRKLRRKGTALVSAQNAALKLLEEPPAWVVFILCTVNSERLLPTVRSRCTEISSGGEKQMDAAMKKLASDYLKAVAAGDRLRLFRWCTANEGMDVRDAADFVACAGELLTEMLCMREKNPSIDRAEILRLGTVLSRCGAMLQVNTGVKHIFGLLAVESLPTA